MGGGDFNNRLLFKNNRLLFSGNFCGGGQGLDGEGQSHDRGKTLSSDINILFLCWSCAWCP